jgi:hypothetical protein
MNKNMENECKYARIFFIYGMVSMLRGGGLLYKEYY